MIDREVRHRVEEAPDLEPAVVLVGPRQVGKTTLALEIGKQRNAVYLDLEDPGDRMPLLADPNRYFASTEDRLVILDEIHRAPEIFQILRGVIDRGRRAGKRTGRFLVLGSASIDLIRQSGESLAGRVAYIDMTPLTIREIPNGEQALNRLWVRGGYPESWLARTDRQSFDLRLNLIRAYLDRDIPMFGPRLPAETIWRLWTMLAHRQRGLLNASGPARSLDTSPNAVGRCIDLLSNLFLVRRLTPYHANVGKRLVKSLKVYVRDSGLVHALLGIVDTVDLLNNPIAGMSWEGFVIEELTSALPWPARAHFYRTQAGAEIDLVIEHRDLTTWAIDIKRSVAAPVTKGFHIARGDLNPDRSFVVYSGDSRFPLGDGIEALGVRDRADLIAGTRP